MLKSLLDFLKKIADEIAPKRKDFEIVKNLSENEIENLPKSPSPLGMDWIKPLFKYKNRIVQAIIWELKYKENTLPLGVIGKMMYEEIIELMSEIMMFDSDAEFLLIPIPITPERRSERGYNQSEYIAKAILENDSGHFLLYAPQWFEKIKETHRQSHSRSKEERMHNLMDCFRADNRVSGKYVILIDDVTTTGSTLYEAKKSIISGGAKNVYAFTIAH